MDTAALAERYAPVVPEVEGTLAEGYWRGAAAGELRLPRCEDCDRTHWYPLRRCPHCQGAWSYQPIAPTATLFTWTILRWPLDPAFRDRKGEVVALVVPDDEPGVRLVTNVVGAETLEVGMPLVAHFVPVGDGMAVPLFQPA